MSNKKKIYALFNPAGEMVKCGDNLDKCINYFPKNTYTAEMWNALFGAGVTERKKIFEENGWSIKNGYFTEDVAVNKSYYLVVDTPTMSKKRHRMVFNCNKKMVDGTIDDWLNEKLENYFWDTSINKPRAFIIVEYSSLNDEIKEIK
jgi:hypothetical protein